VARGAVAGGCRTAACRGGGVGVRRWAAGRLLARGIERGRAAGRAWLAGGGTNPGAFFGRAPAGMETATRSRCAGDDGDAAATPYPVPRSVVCLDVYDDDGSIDMVTEVGRVSGLYSHRTPPPFPFGNVWPRAGPS
jgi:hypothetical protein